MRTAIEIRADRARLNTQRAGESAALESLRSRVETGDDSVTDAEIDSAISARAATDRALDALDAELRSAGTARGREVSAYDHQLRISSEPEVYNRAASEGVDGREPINWFRDAYRAQVHNDLGARERISRHAERVERDPAYAHVFTERATSTGSFAGLVPPAYLIEQAALVARNGRPVANSLNRSIPLPERGMTVNIPRGTTGASAAVQATQNTAVSSTDQVFADLTLPVATVAGQQDVSRQSLERGAPGLDSLIFADILGAYFSAQEAQILTGSGTAGQVLGIQNTPGIGQAAAYTAAATATTFYVRVNGAVAAIAGAGALVGPANLVIMHPRRSAWLNSQVDAQNRPLVVPGGQAGFNSLGTIEQPGDHLGTDVGPANGPHIIGTVAGLPYVTSASVPTAVGTGPEDLAWVVNSRHLMLLEENSGIPSQLTFDQPLAGQLTVKCVVYGYMAFTAGRYPQATYQLGGNSGTGSGHVAPTFV